MAAIKRLAYVTLIVVAVIAGMLIRQWWAGAL
jgi:hypothetical protein